MQNNAWEEEELMKKDEFNILNSFYNGSVGRINCSSDLDVKKSLQKQEVF